MRKGEREKKKRERIIAGPKIPKSVGGRLFSGLCAFFNYIRITNAHTNKHTHTNTHTQTHRQTRTHVDKSLIPHLGICIINVHISYIQIYTQIYIYVCICSADYVQKIFAEVLSQNRTIFFKAGVGIFYQGICIAFLCHFLSFFLQVQISLNCSISPSEFLHRFRVLGKKAN